MQPQELKSVPLFASLNKDELRFVAQQADEVDVQAGKSLAAEGRFAYEFFVIEDGTAEVTREGKHVATLGPGDFFGEMSMIDKQPRSASVTTLEASTFLVLTHIAFERCVEQVPRIAQLVMQCLAQRVREADRKIGTLALMDVYGRVASTLLELSVYSDGKLMVGEKLSQQDLANMVGASREMVNRILKDLSDRGFISIESKAITIINRELPPSL